MSWKLLSVMICSEAATAALRVNGFAAEAVVFPEIAFPTGRCGYFAASAANMVSQGEPVFHVSQDQAGIVRQSSGPPHGIHRCLCGVFGPYSSDAEVSFRSLFSQGTSPNCFTFCQ